MKLSNMKRTLFFTAAALTVAGGVAFTGATLAPQIASAAPAFIGVTMPGGPRGGMGHRDGEHAQYLADALDVSVEDLQAAMDTVHEALQPEDGAGRGFGRGGDHGALREEMQAALAAELGISVDELDAAMDAAKEAALTDAVANGDLTQEQADLMRAAQAVREYVDRDALAAAALGMTVEELQAAREEGTSMAELLEQQGLERAAFAEALKAEADKALTQAVADGVITQEQADQLSEMSGRFMDGGRDGHGARGGHGGRSGHEGRGERGGPDGEQRGPRGGDAPQDGTSGNGAQNQGDGQL